MKVLALLKDFPFPGQFLHVPARALPEHTYAAANFAPQP